MTTPKKWCDHIKFLTLLFSSKVIVEKVFVPCPWCKPTQDSCTCATKEDGMVLYSHYPSCPKWKWKDPDSELVEELETFMHDNVKIGMYWAKELAPKIIEFLKDRWGIAWVTSQEARKELLAAESEIKRLKEENEKLKNHSFVAEAIRQVQNSDKLYREQCKKISDLQSQNKKLEEDIKFLKAEQEKPCSTCKMWASLNSELESKVKELEFELKFHKKIRKGILRRNSVSKKERGKDYYLKSSPSATKSRRRRKNFL